MSSFFPWMGGKSRLAKTIVPLLADHICYTEPFCGAANILFAKPKSKAEVINDINSDLINLFRVVRYHYREFVKELAAVTHSRKDFTDCKTSRGLTDIQRAARYYVLLKVSFGGKGGTGDCSFGYSTTGKGRFNRGIFSVINRCRRRLDGVIIENLEFTDFIARYDRKHTFFYCDPPYFETTGYQSPFGIAEHRLLVNVLSKIKGKFLLSINDHPEIRKLYRGYKIREQTTRYSLSRKKTGAAAKAAELLIANYPLKKAVKK